MELCYKSSQTLCFQGMIKLVLLNCVRFCLSKDCVTRRRSDKKPNLHLKWMETWMKRKNEIRRKPVLSMFSGSGSHLLSGRPAVRIRSRTPVFSRGWSHFRPLFIRSKRGAKPVELSLCALNKPVFTSLTVLPSPNTVKCVKEVLQMYVISQKAKKN